MSLQMLNPNVTYDIKMKIAVRSRGISQDHYGRYRVPTGQTRSVDQAVDEFRRECARQMGVHVSDTHVVECAFLVP